MLCQCSTDHPIRLWLYDSLQVFVWDVMYVLLLHIWLQNCLLPMWSAPGAIYGSNILAPICSDGIPVCWDIFPIAYWLIDLITEGHIFLDLLRCKPFLWYQLFLWVCNQQWSLLVCGWCWCRYTPVVSVESWGRNLICPSSWILISW